MRNGVMVNSNLWCVNRVRAPGTILMVNSICERSRYIAIRESKFIIVCINGLIPCVLVYNSSSAGLVYGVVAVLRLPRMLMGRLAEDPEEGLESDFDGAEPEPVDGFAASVFLSSAFTALSVAASFFSSTFSLSAAGAFEALSVTLFTTSLPASPVRVPSPLETASFTLSRTLSMSSWVTFSAGFVSPLNSVLPESFEAPGNGLLAAAGGRGDGAVSIDDGDRGDLPGALGQLNAILALDGVGGGCGMVELDALIGTVGTDVAGDQGRGLGSHALGVDLDGPVDGLVGLLGDLLLAAVAIDLDLGDLGLGGEGAGRPCAAEPEPRDDESDGRANGDLALQERLASVAPIGNVIRALAVLIVEVILIHDATFL